MFKWIVTLMLISCVAFAHEVCHLDRGDGCTVWYFHSTLNERYDHGHEKVPCDRSFVGRDDVECFRITNTAGVSREAMSRVYRVGVGRCYWCCQECGRRLGSRYAYRRLPATNTRT